MTYLLLFCALALSGVAAFYAIIGLMAIFAAAPIPIAIMGSILEGSKLVVASWLYRNWTDVPKLMKGYLTTALVVLMLLTSMGIFGFLSKAHIEQGVPTADVAAKVALVDEKIKTERENINAARQTISQLDAQVNETIKRTEGATDNAAINRSITIRSNQRREREALNKQIETSQAAIQKLNEERSPIAAQLRQVEAEVGPIKYIAALIYSDTAATDPTLLEKAVRWVTIMIVAVFDPLAVVMLIAANWSLARMGKTPNVPPSGNSQSTVFPDKTLRYAGRLARLKRKSPEIKDTVKEVIKEVVKEAKEQKVAKEAAEHPVFKPESDYWVSRPHNSVDKK